LFPKKSIRQFFFCLQSQDWHSCCNSVVKIGRVVFDGVVDTAVVAAVDIVINVVIDAVVDADVKVIIEVFADVAIFGALVDADGV